MKTSLPLILIALAAAFTGCSVKVDVSDESTAEKSRTAVEVGLLVDQKSEPAPAPPATVEKSKTVQPAHESAPPPPTPDPPFRGAEDWASSESARVSVVVVENVINIKHLDIDRHHDTHYHFYEPRKSRKKVDVRIEVVREPERSERCERLLRDHQRKVAEWEKMMRGGR